jgi:DNA damage-binding protein 1
MDVNLEKKQIDSTSLKSVVLGNRPFLLTEFDPDGRGSNVFACSDRPTVVSRAKERLVFSSVNVEVSRWFGPHSSLSVLTIPRLLA